MEKSKETKLIGVIASAFLLFIVFSAAFAYFGSFNVDLNNNIAVNINSTPVGNSSFVSNATQLNLQVPAVNMGELNAGTVTENNATLSVSLLSGNDEVQMTCTFDIYYEYTGSTVYGVSPTIKTSGVDKEITMTVNAPSGTSNFATETNFDYNTNNGWVTENNKRKVKLVENATISNYGTTAITQEYIFTGKYYNLKVSQEQLANQSFTGIIYAVNNECKSETINSDISTFILNGVAYSFEEGMTWKEWSSSKYNTFGYNSDIVGIKSDDIEVNKLESNKKYTLTGGYREPTIDYYDVEVLNENANIGKIIYKNNSDIIKLLYSSQDTLISNLSRFDGFSYGDELEDTASYTLAISTPPLIISPSDEENINMNENGEYYIEIKFEPLMKSGFVKILFYDSNEKNFKLYSVLEEDYDAVNHIVVTYLPSFNGVYILLNYVYV